MAVNGAGMCASLACGRGAELFCPPRARRYDEYDGNSSRVISTLRRWSWTGIVKSRMDMGLILPIRQKS